MTREDVKQQLAKHPLEWTSSTDPVGKSMHTATIPMDIDPGNSRNYSIEYQVDEVDGYSDLGLSIYETRKLDGERYCDIYFFSSDVPDAKKHSEEHRLNLVCSLLGIKE